MLWQHPFRNAEGLVEPVSVKTWGTMPKCSSVEADSAGAQVNLVRALSIFIVTFYSVIRSRQARAVIFQGVQKEPKDPLGLIQGLSGGWDARSSQKKVKQATPRPYSYFLSVCIFLIWTFLNIDKLRILL